MADDQVTISERVLFPRPAGTPWSRWLYELAKSDIEIELGCAYVMAEMLREMLETLRALQTRRWRKRYAMEQGRGRPATFKQLQRARAAIEMADHYARCEALGKVGNERRGRAAIDG